MPEDIEHLKVHKIQTAKKERKHLPQIDRPQGVDPHADHVFIQSETTGPIVSKEELTDQIIEKLKTIFDPEIPVNVYDLGLIYAIEIQNSTEVEIKMTLTAPACPVAGQIIQDVARATGEVPGVSQSQVQLVWDPPWTKSRMTEAALVELGLF